LPADEAGYRRKVERLGEALNNPADRTEAATALRALIEKFVVTPTGRRGEVDVRLFVDLETVLAWAEDKDVGFRIPATLYLRAAKLTIVTIRMAKGRQIR